MNFQSCCFLFFRQTSPRCFAPLAWFSMPLLPCSIRQKFASRREFIFGLLQPSQILGLFHPKIAEHTFPGRHYWWLADQRVRAVISITKQTFTSRKQTLENGFVFLTCVRVCLAPPMLIILRSMLCKVPFYDAHENKYSTPQISSWEGSPNVAKMCMFDVLRLSQKCVCLAFYDYAVGLPQLRSGNLRS